MRLRAVAGNGEGVVPSGVLFSSWGLHFTSPQHATGRMPNTSSTHSGPVFGGLCIDQSNLPAQPCRDDTALRRGFRPNGTEKTIRP